MARERQHWRIGDWFKVPLSDGRAVIGRVVAQEREVLNSVTCAFYSVTIDSGDEPGGIASCDDDRLVACLFTTRDLIGSGTWKVIGHTDQRFGECFLPFEEKRKQGWVGAKVIGSAIVENFLNAFFGLLPWNSMADPNYFDRLLLHPSKKPHSIILKPLE